MKSQFFQSSRVSPTDGRFLPSDLDQQWSTFSQCRGEARRVPSPRPPTPDSAASFLIRKLDANTDLSSTE